MTENKTIRNISNLNTIDVKDQIDGYNNKALIKNTYNVDRVNNNNISNIDEIRSATNRKFNITKTATLESNDLDDSNDDNRRIIKKS